MPKISVIIPAYNSEGFIKETLDCILRQSLQDVEVIVVNDGSTDSTAEIVGKYCEKYPDFHCITQQNAGVSAARNKGLENATGEYVVFLDSDDYYTDDSLRAFYDTAVATNADCVIGRLRYFDENGMGAYHDYSDAVAGKTTISTFDKVLLWRFLSGDKCYKRETLIKSGVRFPLISFCEEGAFFMSFVYTGARLAGCMDSCLCYRRRSVAQGLSVSQIASLKGAGDVMAALEIIYRNAEKALSVCTENVDKEDYLQEILYKNAHIIVNQFYRLLWTCDDECYSFIVSSINQLKDRMTPNRFAAFCRDNPDLQLSRLHQKRDGFSESASVSVIFKGKNSADYMPLLDSLYGQSCPDFCLIVPESFYDKMPYLYKFSNIRVIKDKSFRREALKCGDFKYRLIIKKPLPLDTRIFRFVIGHKLLPQFIKRKAFTTAVYAVMLALKIKGE